MINKLITFLFFFFFSFFVHAEKIDFCKTIEFDSGVFNLTEITKASKKDECRYNPVPIFFNGIKDYFDLSEESYPTGGISYVTWDEVKKQYGYDKGELDSVILDIISENKEFNYIKELSYKVNINFIPRVGGGLVITDVIFSDDKNTPVSVIRTLFFYSKGNYAASYYSSPVRYSDERKIDFINKVVDLFKSMEINW